MEENQAQQNTEDNANIETPQTQEELTRYIQTLLVEMQSKFQSMSDGILKKIDEMGTKITELESSVTDLMEHAGLSEDRN
ncbi:MAG: hypothetical protein EZS28_008266 [Streblomastix strix]|uniref:Heat shock factor binding protein 1 n=1 Tax=Streblomastix strix TaxID=222440 RepID=A0A5J4WP54_9EUKA|nr:MAG: hypothetical protein EZS28_008266 [Streblomastix strix]